MKKNLRKILETKIQNKYKVKEPGWVYVDITRNRKIHVTIVTENEIIKDELRSFIKKEIEMEDEEYMIGFINIYTPEKADMLEVSKPEKSDKIYTWADGLNYEGVDENEVKELNVISFYSYKGGVGRTIAMIQTAYNLVQEGKRVLMLDLDIEAPSLHKLFSKAVNDSVNGVEYGMVEYLYRSVVQKQENVSLHDIFCTIPLDDIDGSLFLIPALKKMDNKYIYEIGRLQTEQVQDKKIFTSIINQIKDELNIDYIFVDTRAGFNPWGALSLLSISSQVIFVAYPNIENIEGLKFAIEMMDNLGKERYALVMSKVVPSKIGLQKAKILFEQLNITQDSIIPIYYNAEIALSDTYPIEQEEITETYRKLSDYILDNERILENKRYLDNVDRKKFLKRVFKPEHSMVERTDVSRFFYQEQQILLVYRSEGELYGVEDHINTRYNFKENTFLPIKEYILYDTSKSERMKKILEQSNISTEERGLQLIKLAVLGSSIQKDWNMDDVDTVEDVLDRLTERVSGDSILVLEGKVKEKKYEVTSSMIICVNINSDFQNMDSSLLVERIRDLVALFNRNTEKIQFKFVIERSIWEKAQESFNMLKGSTLEIEVTEEDIQRLVIANINQQLLQMYLRANPDKRRNVKRKTIINLDGEHMTFNTEVARIIELIVGIRKYTTTYSSSVQEYIINFFKENRNIKLEKLLNVFDKAKEWELADEKTPRESDGLISFDNLNRALNDIKREEIRN